MYISKQCFRKELQVLRVWETYGKNSQNSGRTLLKFLHFRTSFKPYTVLFSVYIRQFPQVVSVTVYSTCRKLKKRSISGMKQFRLDQIFQTECGGFNQGCHFTRKKFFRGTRNRRKLWYIPSEFRQPEAKFLVILCMYIFNLRYCHLRFSLGRAPLCIYSKKRLVIFLSPAGMSLTKLSLAGN